MKMIQDKEILVGSDAAGQPLKDVIAAYLRDHGWTVTDVGAQRDDADPPMFQRVGFKVGAMISEGEFERAILFCGTGIGIHVAASRCPNVLVNVAESLPSALMCIASNNCNILSLGSLNFGKEDGIAVVEAYLSHKFGDGFESAPGYYEYHKLAFDEIVAFDYEKYKANGFMPIKLGECPAPVIPPEMDQRKVKNG
jgi:ribose 5-phosphate isomerase B